MIRVFVGYFLEGFLEVAMFCALFDPATFLELVILAFWSIAIILYVMNVKMFPEGERRERLLYVVPVISYLFHVVIFYIVVINSQWGISNPAPSELFRDWSSIIRLHGGIAIGFKEFVAYRRYKLCNHEVS